MLLTSAPVVLNGPAMAITDTGATLTATLVPNGSTATVAFQYSTDPGLTPTVRNATTPGFENPTDAAVDAAGDVFVSDPPANRVYKVKPDGSISTLASGFNVALTGVAVDAVGNVYYTDPGDGKVVELSPASVAATPSAASTPGTEPVSGILTGLQPGTTYFYRAIASGPGGTVVAPAVGSFTTAAAVTTAPPPNLVPPSAPTPSPAVLVLTQAASPPLVLSGGYAIYTLNVVNLTPRAVNDVTLIDRLPAGSTLANAAPSQGGYASLAVDLLTDDLGTLAAGASATLTVVVIPTVVGPAFNLAVAAAPDDPGSTPSLSGAITYVPVGPAVVSSTAFPSSIQLTFNEPLGLASATSRVNYELYSLGKAPRALTRKDVSIPIDALAYLPALRVVAITPSARLIPGRYYELKVVGSTRRGLADMAGRKLVGGPGQAPGSDAVLIFQAG